MNKKGRIYIFIAALTIVLLMLLQYNRPKEVNWYPSYVAEHKIPYGTFVLNDILNNFFGNSVQRVSESPFVFLNDHDEATGTYLIINDRIEFGDAERDKLLAWTAQGNTLFLAGQRFDYRFLDSLGLETSRVYTSLEEIGAYRHHLVNPSLSTKNGYTFEKDDYATYFEHRDSTAIKVIGTVIAMNDSIPSESRLPDVIERKFGEGHIILSSFPKAFTNYFILEDANSGYTEGLLSYIDGSRNIYLDAHHKSGKSVYTSPMYIFLNTPELKWAYYLALIGALVYVIFEGKRKQRAIPVIVPLKNQTLAFTRTIADMYYEKGEAKPVSEHMISNFLEYIRSRFQLGTVAREADFYRNLASKSRHSEKEIQRLFAFLERIRNQEYVSNPELEQLNGALEKFKKRAEKTSHQADTKT